MPNDFINIIEREIIKQLRTVFPTAHVFGQFPEAVDVSYPAIIVQLVASGTDEQFMGRQITFGASDTQATGEIYGLVLHLHLIVDKESVISVGDPAEGYKQRRLLNYLMLNVANTVTDLNFPSTVEILERHLRAWSEIGYIPHLELWGASAVYSVSFKNWRA
jgi:hypothetical protein|tara:strand:- start:5574 stop:6059 length:486 start_codon:yes stop_codon:yes gene_type:complete